MDKKCQLEIIWINMWVGSGEPTFTVLRVHSLNCITIVVLTNSYGHPHKELLERLKIYTEKIFFTMKEGEIILIERKNGFYIRSRLGGKRYLFMRNEP